jgi:FixJ family two-component response regulator
MTDHAATVIVVEDDQGLREALDSLLRSVGLGVRLYGSVADLLSAGLPDGPCCLVLDVRLPGQSGLDLQSALSETSTSPPIIFITGHGDIPMSVRAMKAGPSSFWPSPFATRICSMRSMSRSTWIAAVAPRERRHARCGRPIPDSRIGSGRSWRWSPPAG